MDINSLLSPSDTPRANSLTPNPNTPIQSPLAYVSRTLSTASRSGLHASPLSRAIQPPSSIPAHVRSPSHATSHTSPLISPVPTPVMSNPQFARTSSTQSMDTLADLAAMQSHQTLRSTPPLCSRRESSDNSIAMPLQRPIPTSNPRASFDVTMVETPKQTFRENFSGTSLLPDAQHRLVELVSHIQQMPSAYDSHIEMIKILHQGFVDHIYPSDNPSARRDPRSYDLLTELRQARENMEKLFAVGEDQWVDWLQDESILAQSAEERVAVVEICRRAVEEEHGSSRLWSTYAEWASHCYKWANDDVAEDGSNGVPDTERLVGRELFSSESALQVWEEALEQTKDDIANSHLVWDKYMQSRFPGLDQKMPQESVSQVMQSFQERLLVPHITWDQTFQVFSSFVSANYSNEEYESIMAITLREATGAKAIWSARDQHETAISEASDAGDKYIEYQAFVDYIIWEKAEQEKQKRRRTKGKKKDTTSQLTTDLDLINALFQRAELRFPSVTSIWEEHVEYMLEKRKTGLSSVLYRATKHCPWSSSLWKQYLLTSEIADAPYQEIETIKHNATKTGMLEAAGIEDVLKVHDAWCGYLLRRTRKIDSTEEDADVAEMGIRTSIETVQSLASKTGFPPDFDTFFRLHRKYIEYLKGQGRLDNARRQFDDAISVYGKHYRFWLRFYEFEVQKSIHIVSLQQDARDGVSTNPSAAFAVAILKQGLEQPGLDYPEYLIEALLNHCEDYEDAEELQNALSLASKIQKVLVTKRQAKSEQTAQVAAELPVEVIAEERAEDVASGLHIGKRKRSDAMEHDKEPSKRLRSEERIQTSIESAASTEEHLKRDREHASVLVENLSHKTGETRVRQYFSSCGTVQSLKQVDSSEDNSFVVEFRDAEEAQYALSRDGQELDGAVLSVVLNTGSTVYVTNYSSAANESYIRGMFDAYGEIIGVRFPSLQGNKKRRFCYVEFKLPIQAQAALELNGKDVEGLNMVVHISNPAVRSERTHRKDDGRTIFIGHIPFKSTEQDIREEFARFGDIELLKMPLDPTSKQRNKGIAFITFMESASANAAIEMNEKEFHGRNLKVEVTASNKQAHSRQSKVSTRSNSPSPHLNGVEGTSNPQSSLPTLSSEEKEERKQRTIAISNVPDTVNESRIRTVAEKIGRVRKVILRTNHQGALIEFESVADAGKAAIELDGHEIDPGRRIRVTTEQEMLQLEPEKKSEKLGTKPAPPKAVSANVAVRRPVQPGQRKGGHLGQKTGVLFQQKQPQRDLNERQDGEIKVTATTTNKSNDDFRAMINKHSN